MTQGPGKNGIGIGCHFTNNTEQRGKLLFYVMVSYFQGKRGLMGVGLFGFDKLGFDSFPKLQFYYWGGIPEALRQLGCRVLVTKVPRYFPVIAW